MVGKYGDIKLEIMRILLNQDEDISVRGIARRLDLSSGHIFYHLKKMVEMGILKKNKEENRIYYKPQKIFTSEIDITKDKLGEISESIDDPNHIKITNCVTMFLKCYPSLEN